MRRVQKRGQAVIMDLFVAISVFIILVTVLTITWDLHMIRLQTRLEYEDMILRTFAIADSLMKSEGVPFDWEDDPSNIKQLGLAETDGILSAKKVYAFGVDRNIIPDVPTSPGSPSVKSLLKTSIYNYHFAVRDFNGSVYASRGARPDGRTAVNVARIIVYKGAPRIMEFALWKK